MRIGVHLPVLDTGEPPWTASILAAYAHRAEQLGFDGLAVSEHIVHPRPWLDPLTALSIAASATTSISLVTAVFLPGLRPPAVTAKSFSTLDALSDGRVIAGFGAGASPADYAACGIPFTQRWRRLDAGIPAIRAFWQQTEPSAPSMRPEPVQSDGPPIWVGSWGSPTGLRRAARLGDGWLASGLTTNPAKFAADWMNVREMVAAQGKDAAGFTSALSSVFVYVTDDRAAAVSVVRDRLAPALGRSPEALWPQVLAGTAPECAARLVDYATAGVQWLFLWPIAEPVDQIGRCAAEVLPRVESMTGGLER